MNSSSNPSWIYLLRILCYTIYLKNISSYYLGFKVEIWYTFETGLQLKQCDISSHINLWGHHHIPEINICNCILHYFETCLCTCRDTLCRCPLSGLFWFARQWILLVSILWTLCLQNIKQIPVALQIKTSLTMGNGIGYPTQCVFTHAFGHGQTHPSRFR